MGDMRVLTGDLSYKLFVFSALLMLILMLTRGALVIHLWKNDKALWAQLGSPEFLERDHFLQKYPFKGWRIVYDISSYQIRILLIFFLVMCISFTLACFSAFSCLILAS